VRPNGEKWGGRWGCWIIMCLQSVFKSPAAGKPAANKAQGLQVKAGLGADHPVEE